jgi:hypothetical protein
VTVKASGKALRRTRERFSLAPSASWTVRSAGRFSPSQACSAPDRHGPGVPVPSCSDHVDRKPTSRACEGSAEATLAGTRDAHDADRDLHASDPQGYGVEARVNRRPERGADLSE